MKINKFTVSLFTILSLLEFSAYACTGITLKAKDNSLVVARTIEWGESEIDNQYVIVPRNHQQQSLLPDGTQDGFQNLLLTAPTKQVYLLGYFTFQITANIKNTTQKTKKIQLLTYK